MLAFIELNAHIATMEEELTKQLTAKLASGLGVLIVSNKHCHRPSSKLSHAATVCQSDSSSSSDEGN
jgi:hypothetical protein